MVKVTDRDITVVGSIMFLTFGLAIQFLGAWGIDFAFITMLGGGKCVWLPIVHYCMDIGDWWNLNFFVFFPIGAALIVIGAYGLGRAVTKHSK